MVVAIVAMAVGVALLVGRTPPPPPPFSPPPPPPPPPPGGNGHYVPLELPQEAPLQQITGSRETQVTYRNAKPLFCQESYSNCCTSTFGSVSLASNYAHE